MASVLKARIENNTTSVTTHFKKLQQEVTCLLSQLLSKVTVTSCSFYRAAWNATRSYDEISVRLSVCLSNACIVTKRKKAMFRFLYHMKDHLS